MHDIVEEKGFADEVGIVRMVEKSGFVAIISGVDGVFARSHKVKIVEISNLMVGRRISSALCLV